MIALNPNSLCLEAEPHYYDFIFSRADEPIPEDIVRHIENCHTCKEQLNRLKYALSQIDDLDVKQGRAHSAIAAMLRLHFGYIGKPVTCRIVKPFLPTLLDPVLQVRTPTPITAHLDRCQRCSEDLKTIKAMNLNRKQLGRLSRLLAQNPAEDPVSCSEAQAAGLPAALMVFRKATAEALNHLSLCHDCRQALYEYRESLRNDLLHKERVEGESLCQDVSTPDVFDSCVPYGIDPAAAQYAKFREPLASHLRSCPVCLAKVQQLHNTVYGIVERADSDVVTTYYLNEAAEAQSPASADYPYAGYPIRVEVAGFGAPVKSKKPILATGFTASLKRAVPVARLRRFAKIAVVAAAVLIAVRLFFTTPSAKAITLVEINKALQNVRNVYIAHFVPGRNEPVQEQWVSRGLGFYLIKTGQELILRDVLSGQMKVRQLGGDSAEIKSMSPEMISDTDKKMAGSFGLIPFTELSRLPQGSQWGPADGDQLSTVPEGIEVYDLTRTQEVPNGPTITRKWRFFVDSRTGLPQKVELYRKSTIDREYHLQFVKTVEYLTDKQMQEHVDEVLPNVSSWRPEGMPVLVGIAAASSD
ncbi:MAG: hypothetical protein JXN61_06795 [Sedimentisphaerales bacterium]|nr:hypothetical protein [Sedimentisphaerales bacterium]